MTLSHLRACIRAGAYEDDLYSLEERRLLFLRRLIRQGWVKEWEIGDTALEERLPAALDGKCAPVPDTVGRSE